MSYSKIIYCGGRGSSFGWMRYFRSTMFIVKSLTDYVNTKLNQKYYKGTDDPLYFPCVNYDLKKCPKVKISCHYYGLKSDKLYFDEFITANGIFDEIKMAKEYYGNFNYEAHKEIEEYNKNLRDSELKGTFILPEYDPSLSGKISDITVKNWCDKK